MHILQDVRMRIGCANDGTGVIWLRAGMLLGCRSRLPERRRTSSQCISAYSIELLQNALKLGNKQRFGIRGRDRTYSERSAGKMNQRQPSAIYGASRTEKRYEPTWTISYSPPAYIDQRLFSKAVQGGI